MPLRAAVPRSGHVAPRVRLSALAALLLVSPACADGGDGRSAPPPAAEAQTPAPAAQTPVREPSTAAASGPQPGRYGCSESVSRMVNGAFEYQPEGRGYIVLERGGRYTDATGVQGTYRYDEATRESRFSGGALDGAVATPLEGEGPRLWVVIPTESGERRWACSLV